jgi:hypothetical protein
MPLREFASHKELQAYAQKTGMVCLVESAAKRRRMLTPGQYEIVDVRTLGGGVRQAILVSKAVLKAEWERDAPLRDALTVRRDRWSGLQTDVKKPKRKD